MSFQNRMGACNSCIVDCENSSHPTPLVVVFTIDNQVHFLLAQIINQN